MRRAGYERVQKKLLELQTDPRIDSHDDKLRLASLAFMLSLQRDTLLRVSSLRQLLFSDFLDLDSDEDQLVAELRRGMAEGWLPCVGRVLPRHMKNAYGVNTQSFVFGREEEEDLPVHLDPFWWFQVMLRRMDALDIELDGHSHVFRHYTGVDRRFGSGEKRFPNKEWTENEFGAIMRLAGFGYTQNSLRRGRAKDLRDEGKLGVQISLALHHYSRTARDAYLAATMRAFAGLLAEPLTEEEQNEVCDAV